MKKLISILLILTGLALVANALRPARNSGEFDLVGFGRLPVLANGRIKPFDTIARGALLQFQGKQALVTPDGRKPTPVEWLLDVLFRPSLADTYQVFEIVNPDVLSLFELQPAAGRDNKRFAFAQLTAKIAELERQARMASQVESALRTPFQSATVQLYGNLVHYQRLKYTLISSGRDNFLNELLALQDKLPAGIAAVRAKQAGQPHDEAAVEAMLAQGERFDTMARTANILVIPPPPGGPAEAWRTAGEALLETFRTGQVSPHALAYAGLAGAWQSRNAAQFNKIIELYRNGLEQRFASQLEKSAAESRFNQADPFTVSMYLYVLALLVAVTSWLLWPDALGRAAFALTGLAWVVATAGIATRMWLEGRPPVTNLYSSSLFIGWGAVGLCLALEYFFRNALATAAAGVVGFATLIIAHHLSLGGDTLEMMRAVLDSNFWLATHVVVVTAGYSATFLAGFLAIIYVLRGTLTRSLDSATADALTRMVYGIICFATLFSFTGTVLGGIWADQSWGRFWGWDPKENGALMIVIWNALILHARWDGLIRQRGLMSLAIGGNIITAWSWFGTNMLGVGLHSYGFTDAAFMALLTFALSQLALIALASLPLPRWRSFAAKSESAR